MQTLQTGPLEGREKETEQMNTQSSVPLEKLVQQMNLVNRTPEIDISKKKIVTTEINRPALQLTGYFDYFDADRLQIIGYVG